MAIPISAETQSQSLARLYRVALERGLADAPNIKIGEQYGDAPPDQPNPKPQPAQAQAPEPDLDEVALERLQVQVYVRSLLERLESTLQKKDKGYSGSTRPFSNIRSATKYRITSDMGCLIRLEDKFSRIQQLMSMPEGERQELEDWDESVEQNAFDVAAYCLIFITLRKLGLDTKI